VAKPRRNLATNRCRPTTEPNADLPQATSVAEEFE